MKGLCITDPGIEDICSIEIKELIGVDSENGDTTVVFETDRTSLAKLSSHSQSSRRVLHLLDQFAFERFEDLVDRLSKVDMPKEKIKIVCQREGNHDFKSVDVAKEAGKVHKIDYNDPKYQVYIYIKDKNCFVGIDYCGRDLAKRNYRLFTHAESLLPTLAYSMIRLSGYDGKMSLIDYFCGTGTIPIEAAIYANRIPHEDLAYSKFMEYQPQRNETEVNIFGYDRQARHIRNAKKNASIAGVKIEFDVRNALEVEESDVVVSNPPCTSKRRNNEAIRKLYEGFLNRIYHTVKGKVILINRDNPILSETIGKSKFNMIQRRVYQGKEEKNILVLQK